MQARAGQVLCPGPRPVRSGCWPDMSRLRPGPLPGSLDP